jgi:hypothetical protein
MMSLNLIILLAVIYAVAANKILYENNFMMNSQNWQITGNKIIEPVVHQSYNIDREMSHYIMFKDNLINVDYKNKDDRSLWYFESPEIELNPVQKYNSNESKKFNPTFPSLLTFTMTSFMGNFKNLNDDVSLVKIKHGPNCVKFKAQKYDGKMTSFNVPFKSQLWQHDITNMPVTDEEMKNMFIGPFSIEILGDWTRGVEVIGVDNVKIM